MKNPKDVCKTCGADTTKGYAGCCEKHSMECGLCFGSGAISNAIYDAFYKKSYAYRTCSSGARDKMDEVKKWFFDSVDKIDIYGCGSCWSDSHKCTCRQDKKDLVTKLLSEMKDKLNESN